MRRTGRLPRRTPMRRRNPVRGSRFPKLRDDDYRAWIRSLPCAVSGCLWRWQRVECAHVKSRGAGGDDVANCVPLCMSHHRYQHQIGIRSFEREYGLDLSAAAAALAAQHQEEGR